MIKGKVKWFDQSKGFGFLQTVDEDEARDVFVHFSGIVADGFKVLKEGQPVVFEVTDGEKGPQAINVSVDNGARG